MGTQSRFAVGSFSGDSSMNLSDSSKAVFVEIFLGPESAGFTWIVVCSMIHVF